MRLAFFILLACTLLAHSAFASDTLPKPRRLCGPDVLDVGIASVYASKFHGRRTANGETLDMSALTAAHPSAPFGRVLEVQDTGNGKKTYLRVNDRGPHVKGRVIDLTIAAREALGRRTNGLYKVKLKLCK